jgi:hypothetical protein
VLSCGFEPTRTHAPIGGADEKLNFALMRVLAN